MKIKMNSRKFKYGGVSLILTVLVLVAVVIFNVIFAALGQRYEWMYKDMASSLVYSVSENYEKYISDFIIPDVERVREEKGNSEKIKIIFCDCAENIKADESQKYVYGSVVDVTEIFDEYIEIEHINIWEQPSLAREYEVSSTADIVCLFDGRHETISVNDFFIYNADRSAAEAYNGEKMLAAALMRVTQKDTPVCYITANHGEEFSDYELLFSLVQAGYEFSYIDLSSEDIPEKCELLITFDPKQDLISANEFSSISEVDKIENYMDQGGKY
ncbi:MAG: Gldg family protein, partial [Clostridia bacterium]|nr:Gldg family protein [Clostridia bacterium]